MPLLPPGPGRTRSSGWVPPVSWRAMAWRTWSHMGTTRTLAGLLGSALKPRPNRPASKRTSMTSMRAQLREDPAAQPQQLAAAQPVQPTADLGQHRRVGVGVGQTNAQVDHPPPAGRVDVSPIAEARMETTYRPAKTTLVQRLTVGLRTSERNTITLAIATYSE